MLFLHAERILLLIREQSPSIRLQYIIGTIVEVSTFPDHRSNPIKKSTFSYPILDSVQHQAIRLDTVYHLWIYGAKRH